MLTKNDTAVWSNPILFLHRLAIRYIRHLQTLLEIGPDLPVDPCGSRFSSQQHSVITWPDMTRDPYYYAHHIESLPPSYQLPGAIAYHGSSDYSMMSAASPHPQYGLAAVECHQEDFSASGFKEEPPAMYWHSEPSEAMYSPCMTPDYQLQYWLWNVIASQALSFENPPPHCSLFSCTKDNNKLIVFWLVDLVRLLRVVRNIHNTSIWSGC